MRLAISTVQIIPPSSLDKPVFVTRPLEHQNSETMPSDKKKQAWLPLKPNDDTKDKRSKDMATQHKANGSVEDEQLDLDSKNEGTSTPKSSDHPQNKKQEDTTKCSESDAGSSMVIDAHDEQEEDSIDAAATEEDNCIDDEYEDGRFEINHTSRAVGRKLDYYNRFNILQRSRK